MSQFVEKNFSVLIKNKTQLTQLGLASASLVSADIYYSWSTPDEHECDYGASISVRSIKVVLNDGKQMDGEIDDDIYDQIKTIVSNIDYHEIDNLSDYGDEIVA